ncbi:MAG: multicopper oxidase domain-containing protein [Sphingopyxis sp.]|nr:multicopper oxidase domain-containing protein [Sphingopyxis sp.]
MPSEARWPEVTIDIPVGAMRAYEFDAIYSGDWALHCHKSHHTMNAMGHDSAASLHGWHPHLVLEKPPDA